MSEKWGEARGAQILLNSYIYDYMLKNAWGAAARAFIEVAEVPLSGEHRPVNKEEFRQLDGMDGLSGGDKEFCVSSNESKIDGTAHIGTGMHSSLSVVKSESSIHGTESEASGTYTELLQPAVIPVDTPGGFLLEWWTVFWDIFNARSGKGGSDAATAYFAHVQKMKHEQQRAIASMGQPHIVMINQQPNGAAFNPALMRTFDIPNGMMNVSGPSDATAQAMDAQIIGTIPLNEKTRQALMRQAMNNNIRRFSPTVAQIQQLKNQQFLQNQQQSPRDLEADLNGQTQSSRSPALSNQVLSPSKRQKLSPDGSYAPLQGAIQARPQMIQNNLAAPPPTLQTQQAKQMLLNSGINPLSLAQQQFAAFQSQVPSIQQRQLQEYTQSLTNQQQRVVNIAKGQVSNQSGSMITGDGNEIGPNDFYENILSSQQNCTTNPNNHVLQDYQMQLMFLEQQNKKRLMMTHQDQERLQSQDSSFQILSPQGLRNAVSPENAHNDPKRVMQKMTHQNGSSSPADGQLTQQTNSSRNASPNVTGYNGQIQSDAHPQIMFFNQAKAMGDIQPGGMIIGPNGHIMRPPMADQPIYANNPQLQISMMNDRQDHLINPRIVRTNQSNAIWQQQQQIMQHLVNNQNRSIQMQNINHSQGLSNQHSPQNQIPPQPPQSQSSQASQPSQSSQQSQQSQQPSQLQQPEHPQQIQSQNLLQSGSCTQSSQGHIQSSSPVIQNSVSPTPSQVNKPNFVRDKKTKDTRKPKKSLPGPPVTPISESSTPSTPITSHNTGSFVQTNSSVSQGPSLLPPSNTVTSASEPIQPQMDPSSSFANIDTGDPSSLLNDFGATNDLDLGMMNDFDFDSFLEDIRRC
ncbi:uncharacterized protein T551_00883 [Pneumocystis jirovecii RU7]|uniref:LisH domain-containing protein n=1 Tax=Pneumocystis jirovecii (strain RU7) TaxID=1408657 RepID=A0A0W4ZV08_PNEJ7|nr:uncharacterized protein T551_00883 [Pneumocystis jirovecii RU7]KTW32201.1 hypothetical protein T551_00883 [Pneumocystis jirovecii RU7]